MLKKILTTSVLGWGIPQFASAHCPLCTAGAGALAVAAAYLGISSMIIGVLVGAFSLALGMWLGRMPKKEYIPLQYPILALIVFLSTVLPIMPLVRDYAPLYLPFIGEYGKTYAINLYLVGLPIGAFIVWATPYLSRVITRARGRTLPYQGMLLTFVLLLAISLIIQLI